MAAGTTRDEFGARLARAGELEVSAEKPDEVDGLQPRLHVPRARRTAGRLRRPPGVLPFVAKRLRQPQDQAGIVVVEGNWIPTQTTMEDDVVHEFTQSPVGSLPPNDQHVVFDLINIFRYNNEGQIVDEYIRSTTTPSSTSSAARGATPATSCPRCANSSGTQEQVEMTRRVLVKNQNRPAHRSGLLSRTSRTRVAALARP